MILLRYIVNSLSPLNGLAYEDVADGMTSWESIALCVSLLAMLYIELDDVRRSEAVSQANSIEGLCQSMFNAFYAPIYAGSKFFLVVWHCNHFFSGR